MIILFKDRQNEDEALLEAYQFKKDSIGLKN